MVQRSGHCLNRELGEIVVPVKTPVTRDRTERPREPLLQLNIGSGYNMRSIGGRRRSEPRGVRGVISEIPPLL